MGPLYAILQLVREDVHSTFTHIGGHSIYQE
ncbi:MAG: HNH endonuclease [Firmicutes bacterium]|nr:HNH endonuclease [Bacillota bacterium]